MNASHRFSYLATPYSKFEPSIEAAWSEACKLAASLLQKGVKVYSPIAHGHSISMHSDIDPLDHSVWLPFDEAMMASAHSLIVAHLPGWQESVGIAHEIAFFERMGKPIFDLDPINMVMVRRHREKPPRDRYEGKTDEQLQAETEAYLNPGARG